MPKRERRGEAEQAGAGGGADEGEGADLHDVGARGGALADDDVELVVFQGHIELFFQNRLHTVNFVEEKHLALAQVGEDGGQVALDLKGGAGGLLEAHVQLIGNDGGESGFAQPRGPREKHVIQGLAAGFGGFEGDGELFLSFGLANELAQPAGAQFQFKALLLVGARGADQPFRGVVAGDSHAGRSLTGWGCACNREAHCPRFVNGRDRPAVDVYRRLHCRAVLDSRLADFKENRQGEEWLSTCNKRVRECCA